MLRSLAAALAFIVIALTASVGNAEQERRVALVIGNAGYKHWPRLNNPVNDANAMAATLRRLGFDVVTVTDGDRNAMVKGVGEFRKKLRPEAVALFYYAGHGIVVRGKNYMLPVEVDISSDSDAQLLGFEQEAIQDELEDAGVRLSILIFDACRDNPYSSRSRGSRGLAEVNALRGTLLAYATAPGKTADDGTSGHGLYTAELLKAMTKPGLTLEEVFKQTKEAVEKASDGRQTPWIASAFTGNFYFDGPVTVNVTAPPKSLPPSPDAEIVFWQSIASSTNPADFEEYLRRYPTGQFAALARSKLAPQQTRAVMELGLVGSWAQKCIRDKSCDDPPDPKYPWKGLGCLFEDMATTRLDVRIEDKRLPTFSMRVAKPTQNSPSVRGEIDNVWTNDNKLYVSTTTTEASNPELIGGIARLTLQKKGAQFRIIDVETSKDSEKNRESIRKERPLFTRCIN